MRSMTIFAAVLTLLTTAAPADARRGRCDGIHRCTCGSTQARLHGLPHIYKGVNLWQARGWVRAFPRTTARAGAVVYQRGGGPTGHVARIDRVISRCVAVVTDEKGSYERNICVRGAVYVDPNGSSVSMTASRGETITYHSRQNRRPRRAAPVATAQADRLMIH